MPSSRILILTNQAELDLADIWQYTSEQWNERRAETYTEQIWTVMQDLIAFPNIGRNRDELKRGLRSRLAGEHVVIYRVSASEVIVRRIAHQSRDLAGMPGL